MTPPARKAVLNASIQPRAPGLVAPTVQRALEKTAPMTNESAEKPAMVEPSELLEIRKKMSGPTMATKVAHILYSATRKELAPRRIASYSSCSLSVCDQLRSPSSSDSKAVFDLRPDISLELPPSICSLTAATFFIRK